MPSGGLKSTGEAPAGAGDCSVGEPSPQAIVAGGGAAGARATAGEAQGRVRAHCPGSAQWASPSIRGSIEFSVGFVGCAECMKCLCTGAAPLASPGARVRAEERSELPFERGMLESASLVPAVLDRAVAVPAPVPVVKAASGGTECDGCL